MALLEGNIACIAGCYGPADRDERRLNICCDPGRRRLRHLMPRQSAVSPGRTPGRFTLADVRFCLPGRPVGLVNVRLPDDSEWEFKFVKVACNIAKPVGSSTNELSALLRGWFGDDAGLPGTDFKVVFASKEGQWHVRPLDVELKTTSGVITEPVGENPEPIIEYSIPKRAEYRSHVPVYDLVAAAGGWGEEGSPQHIGWIRVKRHDASKGMFAAKVVGKSMEPTIPSGSWCLFRPCPNGSRQNRLLLVQANNHIDPEDGGRYTIKKYRSRKQAKDDGWEHLSIELVPLNPNFKPIEITAEDSSRIHVIGEFLEVLP